MSTMALFSLMQRDFGHLGFNWKKPADMGEVHVFYQDRFLCRAICAELSDRKVTLKEIEQARTARRKHVRAELNTREAMVNRYVEMHHAPPPAPKTLVAEPVPVEARTKLKRYIND
jgi:putative transposase